MNENSPPRVETPEDFRLFAKWLASKWDADFAQISEELSPDDAATLDRTRSTQTVSQFLENLNRWLDDPQNRSRGPAWSTVAAMLSDSLGLLKSRDARSGQER
jgi:hypothetical protein